MCQSNCIFENYIGDCTHEESGQAGACPLMIEEQKIFFFENFYNNQKCNNCIFENQCEYLANNYKDDICQTIHNFLEERL